MADAQTKHHDYHLVEPSASPLICAVSTFFMFFGLVFGLKGLPILGIKMGYVVFLLGVLGNIYVMFKWWGDVGREGREGHHTPVVQMHLRYGMILFIASEVMFFVAWFWAYFDASLYAGEAIQYQRVELTGGHWPPAGIHTFFPFELPLLGTLVLLLSGTTVTAAHHYLVAGQRDKARTFTWVTVALGVLFTCLQAYEYSHAAFGFKGHIYGATFFMATGFHGFHVIVGTIFLAVCAIRMNNPQNMTPERHFGFEAAAWYWHFVDVVWLFLFAAIYVWGYNWHQAAGVGH